MVLLASRTSLAETAYKFEGARSISSDPMFDDTPRLPSAFPASPVPGAAIRGRKHWRDSTQPPPHQSEGVTRESQTTADAKNSSSTLPAVHSKPLIPVTVLDAPTQRLYALAIFVFLQSWKGYDIASLYSAETDPVSDFWFASRWVVIDGLFLYLLLFLQIPWLTFSQGFTVGAIAALSSINILITMKYEIPVNAVFGTILKLVYDRELSIAGRSVKWYDIVHNSSHIQGKYTVRILPEGAAKINPGLNCFCLGPASPQVTVPIRINGTQPISIQLMRYDLQSARADTIDLNHRDIKKLLRDAHQGEEESLYYLPFIVKQPGLYRLSKVRDVSQLDVRIYRSEALVVRCPKATIKTRVGGKDCCKGDMSDLSIEVHGLAPLHVSYNREVAGKPKVRDVQRIHPEGFESPLLGGFSGDGTLLEQGDKDLNWARTQTMLIPVNEPLNYHGYWSYDVNSVIDGCGNTIDYKASHDDGEPWVSKHRDLSFNLVVHERPLARFIGCDLQNPLDLPRSRQGALPVALSAEPNEAPFDLEWRFTPSSKLERETEHSLDSTVSRHRLKSRAELVLIDSPGLYSLQDIKSQHCTGNILEPASCLVITPSEPSLTMESDEILDKCSNSSIGLTIDLDLEGSKPFDLSYRSIKDGGTPIVKTLHIEGTRHQVRFTPRVAGHYAYEFFSVSDKNYDNIKLEAANYRVEQTVKPLAGAYFVDLIPRRKTCIGQSVNFTVKMQGTAPWTLHYDLIHNVKRRRGSEKNISSDLHTIITQPLLQGGEHFLALTSVEDQSGCKAFLEAGAHIDVRFQNPKAQFASIEGKYSVRALEGKEVSIPLRLGGESPWFVKIRNSEKSEESKEIMFTEPNSFFKVAEAGTYRIDGVRDVGCPGNIPERDNAFTVAWIDRPSLSIPPSAAIRKEDANLYVRKDVCEGDEDAVEIAFVGSPPFAVDYDLSYKSDDTSRFTTESFKLSAGLGVASVRLETSKAGLYNYEFSQITDSLYDDPSLRNIEKPLVLSQTVRSRPMAMFLRPDSVYKNCLDSVAGDDIIPIKLHGTPPFSLTMNIKHFATGKSDIVNIPHIDSNKFHFRIPAHALTLGQHAVSVLKVKDALGCTRKTIDGPHVTVAVADVPTIQSSNTKTDFCVGDRIAFSFAGVPPFAVEYEWNGQLMKATNQPSQFVRVAERPGNFTITGLQDSASDCKVNLAMPNFIHEVPSARITEGITGIPEGEQAEIQFKFYGTPPFKFTYTRSEIERKGQKARILEMHSETTSNFDYQLYASLEGTYEVISIEDKYCSYRSTVSSPRKQ